MGHNTLAFFTDRVQDACYIQEFRPCFHVLLSCRLGSVFDLWLWKVGFVVASYFGSELFWVEKCSCNHFFIVLEIFFVSFYSWKFKF